MSIASGSRSRRRRRRRSSSSSNRLTIPPQKKPQLRAKQKSTLIFLSQKLQDKPACID